MAEQNELFMGKGRIEVLPNGELAIEHMKIKALGPVDSEKKAQIYFEEWRNTNYIRPVCSQKDIDKHYDYLWNGNGQKVEL